MFVTFACPLSIQGTYYLNGIDSKWVRSYSRIPLGAMSRNETNLAPPLVLRLAECDAVTKDDAASDATPVASNSATKSPSSTIGRFVEAQRRVATVITGISAGLPHGDDMWPVFSPDNLQRLISGQEQCIRPISGTLKMAMLDKSVVHMKKLGKGKTERCPVDMKRR